MKNSFDKPDLPDVEAATTMSELESALASHLNGQEPVAFMKHLILTRERQRLGDKRRNLVRAERLAYFKEHPEKLPKHLR